MPSVTELLIILLIVALLFGTRKLRSMGGDLGSAIKSFRSAVKEEETPPPVADEKAEKAEGEAASASGRSTRKSRKK